MMKVEQLQTEQEAVQKDTRYRNLGSAVILQAVRDAKKSGFIAEEARRWLTNESEGLHFWCDVAGQSSTSLLVKYRQEYPKCH